MKNLFSKIDTTDVNSKSFKDVKADVSNLNDALSEPSFPKEFGIKISVKVKKMLGEFFTKLIYGVSEELMLELSLERPGEKEKINLYLPEFYVFYDLVITYTMSNPTSKDQIKEDNSNLNSEIQNDPAIERKSSSINEGKICVICFSKPVQNVLPCYHGFCEDCCASWYGQKNKTECLMCRAPIGEGQWDQKIFEVMTDSTVKEKNKGKNKRLDIVEFLNAKTEIIKIR